MYRGNIMSFCTEWQHFNRMGLIQNRFTDVFNINLKIYNEIKHTYDVLNTADGTEFPKTSLVTAHT